MKLELEEKKKKNKKIMKKRIYHNGDWGGGVPKYYHVEFFNRGNATFGAEKSFLHFFLFCFLFQSKVSMSSLMVP